MAKTSAVALKLEKTGRRLRVPMWAVAVVLLWATAVILFNIFVVGAGHATTACVFKTVSGGVPCPTCGSTRAALDLTRGDVLSALWRNPLVLAVEVAVLLWVGIRLAFGYSLKLSVARRARPWLWALAAALFFANWAHVMVIDGPW